MSAQATFSQRENPILGMITEFASKHGQTALKFYLLALSRKHSPDSRLRVCYRYKAPAAASVDLVAYDQDGKTRAGIRGTMKCSMIWQCPVCAARISEERRSELQNGLQNAQDKILRVLVTYTARHAPQTPLHETLDGLLAAYRRLRSGRWWQDVKSEFRLVGSVRATEITYGESGWHPHFHEILLIDSAVLSDMSFDELAEALQAIMAKRWVSVLAKCGLDASEQHGLQVSDRAADVADYVNKFGRMPIDQAGQWSDTHEVTKATSKRASPKGLTPWAILFESAHSEKHRDLWLEYTAATRGKAVLVWARGTRDLLGLGDQVSDQDCPDYADDPAGIILESFNADQWQRLAARNLIAPLVAAAERQSLADVWAIADLVKNHQAADSDRCNRHGIPLNKGETCPVCRWEQSDYGA